MPSHSICSLFPLSLVCLFWILSRPTGNQCWCAGIGTAPSLFLLPSAGGPPMACKIFRERSGWVPGLSSLRPRQESMWDGPEKNLGDFIDAASIVTLELLTTTLSPSTWTSYMYSLCNLRYSSKYPFTSGVPSISHSWRRLSWILPPWSRASLHAYSLAAILYLTPRGTGVLVPMSSPLLV